MAIAMPYKYGLRSAMIGTAVTAGSIASPPTQVPKSVIEQGISEVLRAGADKGPVPPGTPVPKTNVAVGLVQPTASTIKRMNQLVPSQGRKTEDLRAAFFRLAAEWKTGRNPTGTVSRMIAHPAYRAIIRMGPDVIPFVLEELKRDPDEWFYALAKLSGENPVPDASRGRFPQMVEAWVRWGKDNGYLAG